MSNSTPHPDALEENGLKSRQVSLLRRQQTHLRELGQSHSINSLALRSRFVFQEDEVESSSTEGKSSEVRDFQALLPVQLCRRLNLVATDWRQGQLTVASAQPLTNSQKKSILQACTISVTSIKVVAASRQEVLQRLLDFDQTGTVEGLLDALKEYGTDASRLRRLVFVLLREALDLRASDIHLSKKSDPDAWVSYRIDSVMTPYYLLPELLMQALVARIKIECGMDASNSRTAQDGRLTLNHRGRSVDFRVSSQPLVDGESLVLRALDASQIPGLNSLFPHQPKMIGNVHSLLGQSSKTGGLVIVSGATGSGKSTTQYTIACGFERDAVNVITVEDPVEYSLPFAKQIQLQALLNQRAIELERSILRQDPDVLIFGEIRDADSARAALAFAESGHLVITTIHANGVLQIPERFLSIMRQENRQDAKFLIANYLRMAVHQRLVPRLCVCSTALNDDENQSVREEAESYSGGLMNLAGARLHKAVGCAQCDGTGYRGRVVAHETLMVDAEGENRIKFSRAFQADQLEVPADLSMSNGVDYLSRLNVFETLLRHQIVDWPTVFKQLNLRVVGES